VKMALSPEARKPAIHQQIVEMQREVQLLERNRAASYEKKESTIKKSRETILQLREENKMLQRQVAEGDEHAIKAAFNNRGMEESAYRNLSGKTALTVLEQLVLTNKKRLNAIKHTTQTYRQQLKGLQQQYERMTPGGSSVAQSADARAQKREEDRLRVLENNLEKTKLKSQAAKHIMRGYLKLKNHLQEESLTFNGQLDYLEADILKHKEELRNLQIMNNDAQLSKDAAKAELQQQEELPYKEPKESERIIARYRKQVEERKAQTEKADRRAQRAPVQPDELSSEAQRSTTRMTGEEEKSISTFEEAFQRIKEATGVTNIHEIEEGFISQGETHKHLEGLKAKNEKVLLQLKKEKEHLDQQFQDMKYSGEAKLSSDQQMLEECQQHLLTEQQRCDAAKEHLDCLVKTLNTACAGVEHLASKLQHITLPNKGREYLSQLPHSSKESVVDLLAQCELKLQLLQDELHGKDLSTLMKEMEEEEVRPGSGGSQVHSAAGYLEGSGKNKTKGKGGTCCSKMLQE
uniref:Outer dynein arm docking complex subunit 3 n=1 Tax=Myripristis murdjan TaxID=586833 RepID=A0A668AJE2_9TELE